MNILEALKFAGHKELKYFVWGDEVVAKIESSGVALNITTDATGEEVLVAVDSLSHELQLEIFVKRIAHGKEQEPEIEDTEYKASSKKTFLNRLIQVLLSSGGVVILLIIVFVTYDTFTVLTGKENDGFINGMVDLLLWVSKFLAEGMSS